MPAKRLSMRKIKEVLREESRRIEPPANRPQLRNQPSDRIELCPPCRASGDSLAAARCDERRSTRNNALSPAGDPARYRPAGPGLVPGVPGDETQERHPVLAVGGIPGHRFHRVSIFLVLQSVPGMAGQDGVMRQDHRAGEKLFVDYAGQTVAIVIDADTGEVRDAQVFVAVLGASNYTYAEATWTQGLSDWIGSHIRTFDFLGGVVEIVVPDYVSEHIVGQRDLRRPWQMHIRPS